MRSVKPVLSKRKATGLSHAKFPNENLVSRNSGDPSMNGVVPADIALATISSSCRWIEPRKLENERSFLPGINTLSLPVKPAP